MSDDVTISGKEIASLVGFVGTVSVGVYQLIDGAPVAFGVVGCVALLLAILIWVMSSGDSGGNQQQPPQPQQFVQPPVSGFLVGSRIRVHGHDFTILDDTAPSMAAAVRNGGRGVVTAADASGNVGLLFLGFDAAGTVVEASTNESGWQRADLVG
ncbi:hypothetical protein H7J07_04775 [Mycobacterium koreense]|uniref:Uncharacterized protein n=1 Tax=Mycolicibacillus koreensis TaxID=1069220 RepID=A0A7I7SBS5_9MYCO|nr:hypothetical protein [Mycolicibacillus koreensis]MCV7247571.1 hypothetical protein [Mycolicibacillus koreensis]OSC32847.1 hypothetical protein B8W67_14105 [Mycolicibacillus koreensis]BBY53950.1 hypothetical protein MKOR_12010 [Mycolicibacillus koreensis]